MPELEFSKSAAHKIDKRTQKNVVLEEKTEKALNQLKVNPRHPGLETHKVVSKLTGKEALGSWVTGEYRLIWNYKENNRIVILDFGTHHEVYL